MKLIKPSFSIWEQEPGLQGIYKQIEHAGRICYKSEDKITEGSAKPFVDRMIKSGHGAVLEHGTVYLVIPYDYVDVSCKLEIPIVSDVVEKYKRNPYTKWWLRDDIFSRLAFITTNMRVLVENNWLDDLEYLCEPTEYHERRVCVHFVCDRGILAEFTRHRVFSFSAESTRYCNYSKDKFGNELTFIIPPFVGAVEGSYTSGYDVVSPNMQRPYGKGTRGGYFYESLRRAEESYIELVTHIGDPNIDLRMKPQEARAVLPNALKTELIMTGFVSDWKHFFELRATEAGAKGPHPQASELANPLYKEFLQRNYI